MIRKDGSESYQTPGHKHHPTPFSVVCGGSVRQGENEIGPQWMLARRESPMNAWVTAPKGIDTPRL